MCPQLSTPYLATSPQVQKLSDRQYQQELFVSHRKHTQKKQKLINRNRNTQKTGNRMQSFGEVHLELKSCPVLDQQHPILSLYRHFAECSLYTDLQIMKLPFYVQRCTMSSPWQWLPFTSPSGRQSLSSSYTGTNHFFLLHFCTDVSHKQPS